MILDQKIKIGISLLIIGIAGVRVYFYESLGEKMDSTFFSVIAFSFLILVLPWEKLNKFKFAGIEVYLDQPSVQAAISGLGLDKLDDKKLRSRLLRLEDELKLASGGRVMWIDDKPHNILGARRILRALNISITTAISSDMAEDILNSDNDFDLIISDVQREGVNYKQVEGGVKIHEGVNFIVALRKHKDDNIRVLPVIFYAAYDWGRLVNFTRAARELKPEAQISNSMEDFLPKVIKCLAEERSSAIAFSSAKKPTSVG